MAEWLVEQGIGEERALLVESDEVIAARLNWPDGLAAGQVEDAVLARFDPARRRGTARFASGEEALVDRLPAGSREGAPIRVEVTRAALPSAGGSSGPKRGRARRRRVPRRSWRKRYRPRLSGGFLPVRGRMSGPKPGLARWLLRQARCCSRSLRR